MYSRTSRPEPAHVDCDHLTGAVVAQGDDAAVDHQAAEGAAQVFGGVDVRVLIIDDCSPDSTPEVGRQLVGAAEALGAVVGTAPLPRTEVTKKLWAYIKKNGLQDKTNKRMIKADDNLKAIFKKPTVNMFEMTKLVSKHLS